MTEISFLVFEGILKVVSIIGSFMIYFLIYIYFIKVIQCRLLINWPGELCDFCQILKHGSCKKVLHKKIQISPLPMFMYGDIKAVLIFGKLAKNSCAKFLILYLLIVSEGRIRILIELNCSAVIS